MVWKQTRAQLRALETAPHQKDGLIYDLRSRHKREPYRRQGEELKDVIG